MVPKDSPDDSEIAENRELAAGMLSAFQSSQSVLINQQVDLFKWLTASLLVINGVSATAVLNNEYLSAIFKISACGFYGAGTLLALLVAVAGQKSGQLAVKPLNEIIGYWLTVKADGIRGVEWEKELNANLESTLRYTWLVPAIGWLSAIAFVGGGVVAGVGLVEFERDNSKVAFAPKPMTDVDGEASTKPPVDIPAADKPTGPPQ